MWTNRIKFAQRFAGVASEGGFFTCLFTAVRFQTARYTVIYSTFPPFNTCAPVSHAQHGHTAVWRAWGIAICVLEMPDCMTHNWDSLRNLVYYSSFQRPSGARKKKHSMRRRPSMKR